jgi:thiamine biosynthesis lipoprotein
LSAACDGVFDVTVADVLVRHGFLPPMGPKDARSREATWTDLEILAGNRVCWRKVGRIDLGGIAKGYAVDMAVEVLKAYGVTTGMVNAGGDLRVFGKPQPVHVRLPDSPGALAPLGSFADCALATTAAYFSSVESTSRPLEPLVDRQRLSAARGRTARRLWHPNA